MKDLEGKIALVAGATRGAGRGIALGLAERGATVWCTGRSVAGQTPEGRPETIEETAALVDAAGGRGHWRRVDHTEAEAVEALCAEIRAVEGRLDVVVNDIWGGDALTEWGTPFWAQDTERGLRLLDLAVRTHLITSRHATPLLLESEAGLIVEITDGVGEHYRTSLFYDLAKASTRRLAFAMHSELRPLGHMAVAITPGFLRSEAMLDHFGVTEGTWRAGIPTDPHFEWSESPRFVGRALAALAADPERASFGGQVLNSGGLAARYGLHDLDGSRPDFPGRAVRVLVDALEALSEAELGGVDSPEALAGVVGPMAAPFVGIGGRPLLVRLQAGEAPATVVPDLVRL